MVGAVAPRPVAMPVTVVARQQRLQGRHEIVLRTRLRFHECEAGGSVRSEHRTQSVPAPGAEAPNLLGNVDNPTTAGLEAQLVSIHGWSDSYLAAGGRVSPQHVGNGLDKQLSRPC